MNVFQKLMEGKQPMFVNKSNDDLISINDTDTFDYSIQDKISQEISEHNNYNNDYNELAYPFSKRIKLKHEPEKAQENVPVQYTADIIVEIKKKLYSGAYESSAGHRYHSHYQNERIRG
jgi:hypothetical protein